MVSRIEDPHTFFNTMDSFAHTLRSAPHHALATNLDWEGLFYTFSFKAYIHAVLPAEDLNQPYHDTLSARAIAVERLNRTLDQLSVFPVSKSTKKLEFRRYICQIARFSEPFTEIEWAMGTNRALAKTLLSAKIKTVAQFNAAPDEKLLSVKGIARKKLDMARELVQEKVAKHGYPVSVKSMVRH